MRKDTCDLCGREIEPETVVIHSFVPRNVTKQAGMSDSGTATLCINCHKEVDDWYLKRVSTETYDWRSKQFKPKLPAEMVKEYETSYKVFVKYKKWLPHIS